MDKCRTIYKKDKNENIRVWWVEHDLEKYRTNSGVMGGAIVESGWTYPSEKNVGKKNSTTIAEQVVSVVESLYTYQLHQGKYHESIDTIEDGAAFIECMLADTFSEKKHKSFPYKAQPKLDGARGLGVDSDTLQTRNGKQHLSCPHILDDIERFQQDFPDHILDGELYNHELKDNFEKLMSLIRKSKKISKEELAETREKVFFYVYDVITPDPLDFDAREQFLIDNVKGKYPSIIFVESTIVNNKEEADLALATHMELGYEGTILRNPKALYYSGRTKDLIKYKAFEDMECEVVDIVEGKGTWGGFAKSITIKLDDGTIQDSGLRGNFAFTQDLIKRRDELIGTTVTVRYQTKTNEGKLKFPIVTFWWNGKRDI